MPTPDQQSLLSLIDQLPLHNGALSNVIASSNELKAKERAVEEAAKALAGQGKLTAALHTPLDAASPLTLSDYIRTAKRYQLTDEGTLLSKSMARQRQIPDIPDHQAQRTAFESAANFEIQNSAITDFLTALKANPKAAGLFSSPTLRVFDIGYGDGKMSALLATRLTYAGIDPKNIEFHGIDLVPSNAGMAKSRLFAEAQLPPGNIDLIGGELGVDHPAISTTGTPNHALEMERWPDENKYNIVTALNVYNFGDKEKFLRQVDGVLRDDGIAIFQHDAGGDLLEFKKECNATGHLHLRNATSVSDNIAASITASDHASSDLKVPYTITFPDISDAMWTAMKNVQTAIFNKPYQKDVEGTDIDAEHYKKARLLIEFCLGEHLGTFSQDERSFVLDRFRDMLRSKNNELTGVSGVQIALSRKHSQDLATAVEEAARATGKALAPNLEAAHSSGTGRILGG